MLNWLGKLFKNEEQSEALELTTPKDAQAHFVLSYKNLPIGYLNHVNGIWKFYYSEDFKQQKKLDVLVDFPERAKIYESSYLWPFFAHRIPGIDQPNIKEIIKDEKLNPTNQIDLLRRFGKKTITNPFELKLVT
jgi:HipA-like protein